MLLPSFKPVLFGSMWLSIVAFAVSEPWMSRAAVDILTEAHGVYYTSYHPERINVNHIKYYSHLMAAHPTLERDALEFAHTSSHGAFHAARHKQELYVSTRIPGDQGPALRWNLYQQNGRYDAHLFWRVERGGATLLRLNLWPAGAAPQQVMTMQEALDRTAQRRRRNWFRTLFQW